MALMGRPKGAMGCQEEDGISWPEETMRRALAALQGQRVPLFATIHSISRGNVLLRDLIVPGGRCRYAWVPAKQWRAGPPQIGDRPELMATVTAYWRASDDSKDFGLVGVRRI